MEPGYIAGLFANDAMLMVRTDIMMAVLPPQVRYWMIWLLLIGASSLILSFWFREARYVALAYIGAIGAGIVVPRFIGAENYVYGSISVAHALFWTPAVIAVLARKASINFKSGYGLWLSAALATMIFSLIIDWRDAIAYLGLLRAS